MIEKESSWIRLMAGLGVVLEKLCLAIDSVPAKVTWMVLEMGFVMAEHWAIEKVILRVT